MGYKSKRILYIYKKLLSKHHVNVKNLSEFFSTNERTIQRDIEDINTFLKDYDQTVLYEKATHDYYISHKNIKYSNTDINIHATYEMTYQVFKKLNKQFERFCCKVKKYS
ncbi:HTH domain-containing protein [Staphylococcus pettenkoferi]|uniref:HTH domain-containing protein n=1 Tax=Staphylococcus pettenkoferi TaxID=170573 RepID=A0A9Q4H0R7_9STAP|nr:HTH domain-containing protein [Staphylococcus pettenkoferi]MCY1568814.1 HTH domain-containing protein [Staphylococcus pettenkoferi]MCY1595947.1 HTH domain-containing protein [Staphylococcus pettenkoferi]